MTYFYLILAIILICVVGLLLLVLKDYKEAFKENPVGYTVTWESYGVKYSGEVLAYSDLEYKINYYNQDPIIHRIDWVKKDKCHLVYFPKKLQQCPD